MHLWVIYGDVFSLGKYDRDRRYMRRHDRWWPTNSIDLVTISIPNGFELGYLRSLFSAWANNYSSFRRHSELLRDFFFLNRISKQLSTQQFIVDEMNVWMKKKSNIKCKQFLASNEKSEEKKIGRAKSLCIWTNENWELKCYSGHKTGNNSIVVNER